MVFGIIDPGGPQTPAITAPRVAISFGEGGGAGGGLLGGLAAAVGLAAPGPGLEAGLLRLRLCRATAPEVDWIELLLAPVPGGPDLPAPGDRGRVTVSAGDASSGFACTVDLVERRQDGSVRITATNGGRVLARARSEIAFAARTPGEIIATLCAEHGVDCAAGATGETLPRYVADEGRSVLDHIARLAETAARRALFDDDGRLQLLDDAAASDPVATLAAGGALLDARVARREAAGRLVVDGAGASDKGGNAWAWLRKSAGPHRAEIGTAPPSHRRAAPWLRSPDAVAAFADAAARGQDRAAATGRFLAAAVPAIVPGAVFAVSGTADAGRWLALAVDMRLDPDRGLTSDIRAVPVGGGTGGPGGLAGALAGALS